MATLPALKRGEDWDAEEHVAATEQFTHEVGGFVPLYQDVWMNRTQFEAMFDHRLYRRMRERLGAIKAFPEVWDKVRLQPKWRTDKSYVERDEPGESEPTQRSARASN